MQTNFAYHPLSSRHLQFLPRYWERNMDYDKDKLDQVVLALLYHNAFDQDGLLRAWKSFDWDAMDRLHKKGFINDPKSKAKSVIVTEEGLEVAEKLFKKYFGIR
jgi:hypothetical protein